ncbi:MAG: 4Fe-4S dicluster domain-containing protein [Acidobacteria bacterium]|nr:MAG: 4Fe-4S dicluster domain-containing protein [Acidobacteriota bacterium]REK03895.1 MAG: 4Fe-4S dicluster domain-containing protein [Acidobacteriota bacterium]
MGEAIERCVHCGFCLATCPTYRVLGEEMDSPRGRIFLIKEMLEERLPLDEVLEHLDPCLGCLACETSCPSGVRYRELLQPVRTWGERHRRRGLRGWWVRLRRLALLESMARPTWFRAALRLGRMARPLRGPLRRASPALAAPLDLVPARIPAAVPLPRSTPARGGRRGGVLLLAGCVQQVLEPRLAAAVVEVLARNGVEVVVPEDQGCCGALALHVGEEGRARRLARRNLRAFAPVTAAESDFDALIVCAAGCGSGLQEHAALFAGSEHPENPEHSQRSESVEQAERAAAERLAARTLDATTFLDRLGLIEIPAPLSRPLRVAVHDPCHLLHAQRERSAPRRLLASIPGVELVEPRDAEVCCGSAGLYNLEWPRIAGELGRRKAESLLEPEPDLIASGNLGCSVQLRVTLEAAARRRGDAPPVWHPLEILAAAYRGELDDLPRRVEGARTGSRPWPP